MVKLLLAHNNVDVETKDSTGRTLLLSSVGEGYQKVVVQLWKKGVDMRVLFRRIDTSFLP
jgi:ankyrin repeat protein